MKFARVGGLSATDYQPVRKKAREPDTNCFHVPPRRFGIYAFIWPYMEPFLWAWSEEHRKEHATRGYRIFRYEGPIWCHFVNEAKDAYPTGSWTLTDTDRLPELLKKVKVNDRRALTHWEPWKGGIKEGERPTQLILDPYVCSLGGNMSRDHLEVFIEAKHLNRIG